MNLWIASIVMCMYCTALNSITQLYSSYIIINENELVKRMTIQ